MLPTEDDLTVVNLIQTLHQANHVTPAMFHLPAEQQHRVRVVPVLTTNTMIVHGEAIALLQEVHGAMPEVMALQELLIPVVVRPATGATHGITGGILIPGLHGEVTKAIPDPAVPGQCQATTIHLAEAVVVAAQAEVDPSPVVVHRLVVVHAEDINLLSTLTSN